MYEAVTVFKSDDLYEATVGDHTVLMDTGTPEKQAQSPLELLLSAVSGCASVDVVEIIRKRRRTVSGLRVETRAERRDAFPRIFTSIHLHFVLSSPDANVAELERAVALSMDKYCSVAGMLNKAADVTWSCAIEG